MGNKMSAHALRLGVSKTWNSLWFNKGQDYIEALHQDLQVKKYIKDKLNLAGLDNIVIRRGENTIDVTVYVARPGVAIGRGGSAMDLMKKDTSKMTKLQANININEVKKADLSARILARSIADALEHRLPLKPAMENAKTKAVAAGADGVKIWVSGRINGASQARVVKISVGQVPLQTIKADLDYAEERASTRELGIFGIKVWIYYKKKESK